MQSSDSKGTGTDIWNQGSRGWADSNHQGSNSQQGGVFSPELHLWFGVALVKVTVLSGARFGNSGVSFERK